MVSAGYKIKNQSRTVKREKEWTEIKMNNGMKVYGEERLILADVLHSFKSSSLRFLSNDFGTYSSHHCGLFPMISKSMSSSSCIINYVKGDRLKEARGLVKSVIWQLKIRPAS